MTEKKINGDSNCLEYIFCLILFLLLPLFSNGQNVNKDTIYLLFQKNEGNSHKALGKKFINGNGINFNLLHGTPLLHKDSDFKDTLYIDHIKKFKLVEEEEIDEKVIDWRVRYNKMQKEKLGDKYNDYYVPVSNRNYMFQVYIVEKITNEKIVVYEVNFRNEGVID